MDEGVLLAGRILFSLLFVMSGFAHFQRLEGMAQYTAAALPAPLAPLAKPLVAFTGLMVLYGGVAVAVGFYADLAGLILATFLIPTTLTMHRFWGLSDPQMAAMQQAHFMKNVALAGAALVFWYLGSGELSVGPNEPFVR